MEAAAIISLISAGHWLEARVSDKASGALKSLLNLAPQTARRKNSTGNENEIPVAELKIGDEIILRPGDRVPVDGIIVEGDSVIDESALTGESIPIDKKIGSELFTGTVNLNGRLAMRVIATGESTALAVSYTHLVMLPKMDGWELLARLRKTKRTPVLMLTARDQTADRVRGLDTGADDYLIKPCLLYTSRCV